LACGNRVEFKKEISSDKNRFVPTFKEAVERVVRGNYGETSKKLL
jgi:hypothetical protein